jgi:hypothetical protein
VGSAGAASEASAGAGAATDSVTGGSVEAAGVASAGAVAGAKCILIRHCLVIL